MNNNSRIELTISGKKININRPEPVSDDIDIINYTRKMDPQIAVDALIDGNFILIDDYFSSGLAVLNQLKISLQKKRSDKSFSDQRDFRSIFRELSSRMMLLIKKHEINAKKSPDIGWLKILYPDLDLFLLPFPKVQGLNSAWQWYKRGIAMPVLEEKIFPFYGTYFPTRFEHLQLLDHWLKQLKGEKKDAFDIGIGCGILSFQMLKHNFEKIYATDTNPNAIYSVHEHLVRNGLDSKIKLLHGDLFKGCPNKTELIVFNPPWLPETYNVTGLDSAIYYNNTLFPRFFEEAIKRLKPDGRVVLLFSNLGQITGTTNEHPIEEELANGGRFYKEVFVQKKVSAPSGKTRRKQSSRKAEMVELWVLKALVPKDESLNPLDPV